MWGTDATEHDTDVGTDAAELFRGPGMSVISNTTECRSPVTDVTHLLKRRRRGRFEHRHGDPRRHGGKLHRM
jgi:hypothetical protein